MNIQTLSLVTGGWLLTAGVAFYSGMVIEAGKLTDGQRFRDDKPTRLVDSPVSRFPGSSGDGATSGEDAFPPSQGSASAGSDAAGSALTATALEAALSDGDYLSRSLALAQLLQTLSPENLGEAKAIFEELISEGAMQNRREIEMFLHAWARFDPESALEFVRESVDGRGAMFLSASVVNDWMARDKQGALGWVTGLEDESARRGALTWLLRSEAMRDPEGAVKTLGMIPPDQLDARMARTVAERYAESNPQAALNWAEGLQDAELRNQIMDDVVEGWAKNDAKAAASWLESKINEPYAPEAVREVVDAIVRTNPLEAAHWLSGLPEGPARQRGMIELIQEWSESDPIAAGQYLNQLPEGEVSDPAVNAYARNVAKQDMAASMDWASTIVDEGQRTRTVRDIGRYWFNQDPESATAYFSSQKLSPETIQSLSEDSDRVRPPWRGR